MARVYHVYHIGLVFTHHFPTIYSWLTKKGSLAVRTTRTCVRAPGEVAMDAMENWHHFIAR